VLATNIFDGVGISEHLFLRQGQKILFQIYLFIMNAFSESSVSGGVEAMAETCEQ